MSESQGCCGPLLPGLVEPRLLRLANGAEVVTLPLADAPLTCLDFWCRAGSLWEQPEESGLAHFLEHMVFKGSQRLAAGEFDRRIEALGGSSNAATGFDDVHYHVLIPPAAAAEALELLLDLVLAPKLDPEAFAMERQVVLEELAQSEDQPDEVALQQLLAAACPDHPYGLPILGRREGLQAHQPEAMARFHGRLYGSDRCVLAISGCLPKHDLQEQLASGPLATLPRRGEPSTPPPLQLRPGEHHLVLPRLEAGRLLMAWWLPPASELEPLMGADLATGLLADGRRSRLVERLREQLRLVESIDLDLHAMECGSLALLEAVCDPADLAVVRATVQQVWQELSTEAIPAEEWQRACRLVTNGYRFGLEAAAALAGLIGNSSLWGRRRPLAEPLELIDCWNPRRLQEQMLPLLDPARACVLQVVPA
ncbi:MAG: pitrilysin family protein [Synechococcaceae cyanobacterium]|nr:pitrilysin family protein [Synechococcaceae cyanobacterium]